MFWIKARVFWSQISLLWWEWTQNVIKCVFIDFFYFHLAIFSFQMFCKVLSFVLLYFLLSSFVWMSLHAIHLFRVTYGVFKVSFKNWIFLTIGYGSPLLISIIGLLSVWPQTGSFGRALVGSDYLWVNWPLIQCLTYSSDSCWISSPKYPNNVWILIGICLLSHSLLNWSYFRSGRNLDGNKFVDNRIPLVFRD